MIRLHKLKDELAGHMIRSGIWQRWQQLPSRDRLALKVLGGFFALLLFYAFIWLPIDRKLDSAGARYRQERDLLSHLQEQAPMLRSSIKGDRPRLSSEQLQGVVTSTAQKHGLVLERLDSEGGGRLLISLAQAPFEKLLHWLTELEEKGVALTEASLEKTGTGVVDARLTLTVEGA